MSILRPTFFHTFISFSSFSFPLLSSFFFFNDPATTEIYTLSLHDALPIWPSVSVLVRFARLVPCHRDAPVDLRPGRDRKSTRLNSSHVRISYAVFCLKKKKKKKTTPNTTKNKKNSTPLRQ